MTLCIVCPSRGPDDPGHDPDYERGYRCCFRAWGRMAGALRPHGIPDLHGALELTKGQGSAPKVSGTRDAPIPLRLDALDLSMPARPGSLGVRLRGLWSALGGDPDQEGHLAVATELETWARDWASERSEYGPDPQVPLLCSWLLDRLDWACKFHIAIDEFAADVRRIHGSLMAANGLFDAPPETLSAPCWGCGWLTLIRDGDAERVLCAAPSTRECSRLMTDDEYALYAQRLIKENPS